MDRSDQSERGIKPVLELISVNDFYALPPIFLAVYGFAVWLDKNAPTASKTALAEAISRGAVTDHDRYERIMYLILGHGMTAVIWRVMASALVALFVSWFLFHRGVTNEPFRFAIFISLGLIVVALGHLTTIATYSLTMRSRRDPLWSIFPDAVLRIAESLIIYAAWRALPWNSTESSPNPFVTAIKSIEMMVDTVQFSTVALVPFLLSWNLLIALRIIFQFYDTLGISENPIKYIGMIFASLFCISLLGVGVAGRFAIATAIGPPTVFVNPLRHSSDP